MAKNVFVAGLAYSVTDEQLESLFAEHGSVRSAKVIIEHDTGRSKGFGFVEMSSDTEAMSAISALNNQPFEGRTLMVKEARPKGENTYAGNNNRFQSNSFNKGRGNKGRQNRDGFNRRSR